MEAAELHTLLRGVLEHSDPKKGLSNDIVERFCHLAMGGSPSSFRGVFSVDCVPHTLLKSGSKDEFSIIINLGESKKKGKGGGHFVTLIVCRKGKLLKYFDSYALPVWQPHMLKLIRRWRGEDGNKKVELSCKRAVQDENSRACGLYAALFACFFDPIKRQAREKSCNGPFSITFHRRKLKANDALCVRYLQKLIYASNDNKKR